MLKGLQSAKLANAGRAFATLHQRAPQLFEAVADKAEERLEWVFAIVNQRAPRPFWAVADKAEESTKAPNTRNFANVVWTLLQSSKERLSSLRNWRRKLRSA